MNSSERDTDSAGTGGRQFQRVAGALRHRILEGAYGVGTQLPAHRDLAREFGVSRHTIQRVMNELASEGWIVSQDRRGSVVRAQRIHSSAARPPTGGRVTLGALFDLAFAEGEVAVDAFSLTSETLEGHVRRQGERLVAGEIAPRSVRVRLLLPSPDLDMPYPRPRNGSQDTRLRERLREMTEWHTRSLARTLREMSMAVDSLETQLQVRHVPLTPAHKLYLFSGRQALHGLYKVVERPVVLDSGDEIDALDVLGLGSFLTHFVKDEDPESQGSLAVDDMQSWFDASWDKLAVERTASAAD